jgi:hypothetical protein
MCRAWDLLYMCTMMQPLCICKSRVCCLCVCGQSTEGFLFSKFRVQDCYHGNAVIHWTSTLSSLCIWSFIPNVHPPSSLQAMGTGVLHSMSMNRDLLRTSDFLQHLSFGVWLINSGLRPPRFQVFQVAYIIIKAANAPRPGNWILERSVDGVKFKPWQYYAVSDTECLTRYKITPRRGPPTYRADNEVICTSYYSKLVPLEHGEVRSASQKWLSVIWPPTHPTQMSPWYLS